MYNTKIANDRMNTPEDFTRVLTRFWYTARVNRIFFIYDFLNDKLDDRA